MIFNTHYPYIGGGGGGVPQFEYTGNYEFIDDGGGNWRIKFLTSGVFTPLKGMAIDAFLVGGGASGNGADYYRSGGGGGGGYTATHKSISLTANTEYQIAVGAGGARISGGGADGGTTSAFGYSAEGGKHGTGSLSYGGSGGSGGGGNNGSGGSDGGNGGSGGGTGQGTTTREFGESTGELYAGGGGGYQSGAGGEGGGGKAAAYKGTPEDGTPNSGGGGGGGAYGGTLGNVGGAGGSGIVIVRNAR